MHRFTLLLDLASEEFGFARYKAKTATGVWKKIHAASFILSTFSTRRIFDPENIFVGTGLLRDPLFFFFFFLRNRY